MARRYTWSKRHGRYIDTHKRRAMRTLVKIAGESPALVISGGFPPSFDDNRRAWLDFQKCENYKWFLSGTFVAYRYY